MGYLVISRKLNERIAIGDDIEIMVSHLDHDRVDIAIKAPKDKKIKRKKTILQEQEDVTRIRDKSR